MFGKYHTIKCLWRIYFH